MVKNASERVPNPNILVNLVSRRVRELNRGEVGSGRPLVSEIASLNAGDIALSEIIEGRIGFDLPEFVELTLLLARTAGGLSTGVGPVSRR